MVQRNLRKYQQLRNWAWYRLWQKVKPLLNVTRIEDEIKALEDKAAKAQESFEKEEKMRKELEVNLAKMTKEKEELLSRLQAESGTVADFHEKQNKLQAQKADLESQLAVNIQNRNRACLLYPPGDSASSSSSRKSIQWAWSWVKCCVIAVAVYK